MPLIGREKLLESIVEQLAHSEIRLMTLIGPGGVGKTRLACEVARQAAPSYNLVRLIDLTPLHADLVAAVIADVIGVQPRSGSTPIDRLRDPLHKQRTLLVLDNFEHVLDAGPQVAKLLTTVRDVDLIVTSRAPLRLRWEHLTPVPPLTLPRSSDRSPVEELAKIPAVALFVGHLTRLHPHFELTEANAEIVSGICQQLDGLPLALELAASNPQVLSLSRLHGQLEWHLAQLESGPRDLPTRQRSMRAAIEWSYQLLTSAEQLAARRASIFAGGASVDAAEEIMQLPTEAGSAQDLLVSLVEKSLLALDASHVDSPRFSMLKTVRKYLLDQLAADEGREALERRFAEYYLGLAEHTAAALGGSEDVAAILVLNREHENFRSILQAAVSQRNVAVGLRLALALASYWKRSGQLVEAGRWLEQIALHCDLPELIEQRIEVLAWAGRFALFRGDLGTAGERLVEALNLSQSSDCAAWCSELSCELAHVRLIQGDTRAAEALLEDVLARSNAESSAIQHAEVRFLRGSIMAAQGRGEQARGPLSEAIVGFEAARADERVTKSMLTLADLRLVEGAIDAAKQLYMDALVRAKVAGIWHLEARCRIGLGIVASWEQDEDSTLSNLRAAFEIAEQYGDELSVALVIDALATLGVSRSRLDPERLQLTGLADAMLDRLGQSSTSLERSRTAPSRLLAREMLGDDEVMHLEANGRHLSLEHVRATLEANQAGEWARDSEDEADQGPSQLERLTRRERKVVQLVAKGLTNRQIALELDIAERTVDTHVSNMLRKLALPSRASAAAWAVEQGLTRH